MSASCTDIQALERREGLRTWHRIASAPKDGTRFHAKLGSLKRVTWWGKASHVPMYGWCHGKVEDVDLWQPSHWKPR
jgi:hypothetical protein